MNNERQRAPPAASVNSPLVSAGREQESRQVFAHICRLTSSYRFFIPNSEETRGVSARLLVWTRCEWLHLPDKRNCETGSLSQCTAVCEENLEEMGGNAAPANEFELPFSVLTPTEREMVRARLASPKEECTSRTSILGDPSMPIRQGRSSAASFSSPGGGPLPVRERVPPSPSASGRDLRGARAQRAGAPSSPGPVCACVARASGRCGRLRARSSSCLGETAGRVQSSSAPPSDASPAAGVQLNERRTQERRPLRNRNPRGAGPCPSGAGPADAASLEGRRPHDRPSEWCECRTPAGADGLDAAVRAVDLRAVQRTAGAGPGDWRAGAAALPAPMLRLELFRSGDTLLLLAHLAAGARDAPGFRCCGPPSQTNGPCEQTPRDVVRVPSGRPGIECGARASVRTPATAAAAASGSRCAGGGRRSSGAPGRSVVALLPRDSVDGAARWAASHAPRGRYAMQEVHSAARGYGPYAVPRTALFATPLPLDLSLADSPPESPGHLFSLALHGSLGSERHSRSLVYFLCRDFTNRRGRDIRQDSSVS
ncbi:hypothetical protein HPB47_005240 [Ixodes persulcatus]|uniref:Uncharacterized protein n=1 Tax=Ixodes persulcatus TaxID=34615 RepID=A0AC60PDJ7_IXOPE|nr:hypothetical protein HPB47_005240 [Ixodes persulcatus]